MAAIRFFGKKKTVLVRCTHCCEEYELSPREVRQLEKKNTENTLCPLKEECCIYHIGFMIPVNYTDQDGKRYLYHEIKPKIKNLNPDTLMERLFNDENTEGVYFFNPFDED